MTIHSESPPASPFDGGAEAVAGQQDLQAVAERVTANHGAAPCAAVGAAVRRHGRWQYGWGVAGTLWPASDAPTATVSTVFDLASLTKPLVALALARLVRGGTLAWDEPLGAVLPALSATRSADVPVQVIAEHRAGLEAHRELFVPAAGCRQPAAEQILRWSANGRRPSCAGPLPQNGFPPIYSDLGYMMLGAVLSARGRSAADAVVAREVAVPLQARLGSARQLALAAPSVDSFLRRAAPTEHVPWRGGTVHGVVHDENSWVLAGAGMAGHAGAFGDVGSVVGLGVALVDGLGGRRPDWLTSAELQPLVRVRPGGSHAAGFDHRSGARPSSGHRFGPRTFGHLGFTGTSLWIDPDRELVGVLLTNRVHPSRGNEAIRAARPDVYDRIYEAMVR